MYGNELAFPFVETAAMQGEAINFGLTKRELFAAMAMQGMVADWGERAYKPASVAAHAVAHADALLAALATPPEGGGR